MAATSRQLSTAAVRREALVEAAAEVFAERGFHGTPTTAIAKQAGISQAYLFRLFPTKEDLYVAAVERCYARIEDAMRAAAEAARQAGEPPLELMGHAYVELLQDPRALQGTLQAFAAASSGEGAIREAVRAGYGGLVELVQRLAGADAERTQAFFAHGMLITVLAGMDAPAVDAPWARALMDDGGDPCGAGAVDTGEGDASA